MRDDIGDDVDLVGVRETAPPQLPAPPFTLNIVDGRCVMPAAARVARATLI